MGVNGDGVAENVLGLVGLFVGIEAEVEGGLVDVEADFGGCAFELKEGALAAEGEDGLDAFHLDELEVAGGGFKLDELGRSLEFVEDEDAVGVGQGEAFGDFGHAVALVLALVGFFLVEGGGFLHGGGLVFGEGGLLGLPFLRSFPVDEVGGKLFPFAATLDADVADAVADEFVFTDELEGAVFEDEAVIDLDAGDFGADGEGLAGAAFVGLGGGDSGKKAACGEQGEREEERFPRWGPMSHGRQFRRLCGWIVCHAGRIAVDMVEMRCQDAPNLICRASNPVYP